MNLLLRAAVLNRKHAFLLFSTVLAMLLLTLASQLEIFSLGVIAKTGPDFFQLFGPEDKGKLVVAKEVTLADIEKKWGEMATEEGVVTHEAANAYLAARGGNTPLQKAAHFLDDHFRIHDNLLRLLLLLIVVALFKAVALFSHRYFTQVVAVRISRDLRLKYFEHIQSLPMAFYHDYDIGALSARVTGDAGFIAQAINSMLINYLQAPFAIISTLLASFYISWRLSSLVFIGFPLLVFPMLWLAKRIKRVAKQIQSNQESFAMALLDFLSGIMTVKIFAMEDFSLKKYKEQNNRMARLEEKSARYGVAARPILHTVSSIFFALVILSGLYIFQLGPAELLVFCGLLYVLYEPVKKFAEENNTIYRGVAAAERMYEVLNLTSTITDSPDAVEMQEFTDHIAFCGVSFAYREDWVLQDLSFTVKKGETVAIVGPTGAGKSTIAQLLPRLYDVQKGDIQIDGRSIRTYTQRSLREHIAFVPQRPFLFLDTIQENITFGRPFLDADVQAAAQNAHAEEFIVRLPGGYQFKLEEAGKNLSGGQQQRLAIARALVKNAPILILDEATSALDAVSERKIKEAIATLHGKLTQIIIAHRLSTIEHADRIIYVERGQKVAEGTKEELLASSPSFRAMWQGMRVSP